MTGQADGQEIFKPGYIVDQTYLLKEILGKGGMGSVFRAEHLVLKKDFALKLLSADQISQENWQRFSLEARAIARMDHPAIVKIHNMGIDRSSVPYYVMDYLNGSTLAEIARGDRLLPPSAVINLFKQIASGLSYAHKKGFIHRDIKPSNLVVEVKGKNSEAKIVDFGIAKFLNSNTYDSQIKTKTGEIFGSPLYMSPEQCLGTGCDQRSDIYSLGCTLFEVLTGQPPFKGANALETMMQHQTQPPPSLFEKAARDDLPEGLDDLVKRMLEKDQAKRYQTMDDVYHDLERIANGKPIGKAKEAGAANNESQIQKDIEEAEPEPSHHKKLMIAALVSIFLLSASAFAFLYQSKPHPKLPVEKPVSVEKEKRLALADSEFPNLEKEYFNPDNPVKIAMLDKCPAIIGKIIGKQKVLVFPDDSIGDYCSISPTRGQSKSYPAQSKVVIASDAALLLTITPRCTAFFHPQIYERLGPFEVIHLDLAGMAKENEILISAENLKRAQPCALKILKIASTWPCLAILKIHSLILTQEQDIKTLNSFKHLRMLIIENCLIVPPSPLPKENIFNNLDSLTIANCDQTGALLLSLAQGSRLKTLYLEQKKLSVKDIVDLSHMSNLQCLSLKTDLLTKTQLYLLAGLKPLRSLRIVGCQLSQPDIQLLCASPNLAKLNLDEADYQNNPPLLKTLQNMSKINLAR